MSPSSCKSLLSWAQMIELDPISGHQNQHETGHVNHIQHKPLAGVKADIKKKVCLYVGTAQIPNLGFFL
jgi:hypothetical protein